VTGLNKPASINFRMEETPLKNITLPEGNAAGQKIYRLGVLHLSAG
jgi:hypothetical protein